MLFCQSISLSLIMMLENTSYKNWRFEDLNMDLTKVNGNANDTDYICSEPEMAIM